MDLIFHTSKDISSWNRKFSHSPLYAFENTNKALKSDSSSNVISLNGKYEFAIYESPEKAPEFYKTDFDGFTESITVPGNWETQSFSSPIYTNMHYPWSLEANKHCAVITGKTGVKAYNAPVIPEHNPTGCYRKWFELPDDINSKKVCIYFEGVETAYYLWINGKFVGYSEDSKLPSEFDITPFVVSGKNLISVMVTRFATSTYFEDQDYWYLSGIYRNVQIIVKPRISIEDYKISAIPDLHSFSGEVCVDVSVTKADGYADHSVRAEIYRNNTLICENTSAVNAFAGYRNIESPSAHTARLNLHLNSVELWEPETPFLYKIVLSLIDADGKTVDIEAADIGFKKLEIKNGILYLNGKRLIVKGVNRHEHCPDGRTVSTEHMIKEIKEMKRIGINSVRTCHYPDCPEWYRLCDRYGLLLICECNLETHGMAGELSHDPSYSSLYLERAVRMVQTFKNHVSIYSWSLGNESGFGASHAAMYGFIKEYDKDRLCQYEAGGPPKNISDIRGNMYAPISSIETMAADIIDDRPIILVEYLYQICNSGGGLYKFNDLIDKYQRFQGGYIWDWQDKSLIAHTDDGRLFYGYGGDFNEDYTDEDNPPYMTNNGIVMPDLTWKPVACEVRHTYSPIQIKEPESTAWSRTYPYEGRYIFINKSSTRPMSDFSVLMQIKENGYVISEEKLNMPEIMPGCSKEITPDISFERRNGCEYYIDFIVSEKEKQWYSEDGDIVIHSQFELNGYNYRQSAPRMQYPLYMYDDTNILTINISKYRYFISKQTSEILSVEYDNLLCLENSIRPCFSRPRSGINCCPNWGAYDEYHIADKLSTDVVFNGVMRNEKSAVVLFEHTYTVSGKPFGNAKLLYMINEDGTLTTEYTVSVLPKLLPRIGLELIIPGGFEKLSYYGRGENENYPDRKSCTPIGIYRSNVSDLQFQYNPPSENGGHEDCRWTEFRSESRIIRFTGMSPFHFDAHHYPISACNAAHDHEIARTPEVYFHIDAAHSQIGSDMAWSSQLDESLNIGRKTYHLGFEIFIGSV